jgi:hypothetical protein
MRGQGKVNGCLSEVRASGAVIPAGAVLAKPKAQRPECVCHYFLVVGLCLAMILSLIFA